MIRLFEKNRKRFADSLERIRLTYLHKNHDFLPFVLSDVNYWVSGEDRSSIPPDYFTDFQVMLDYQVEKIKKHLNQWDDDYIPLLFPWYGTGVVPSALGCNIVFPPFADPAVEGTVIREPQDIRKMVLPDPYRDGLMPRVLACID